MSRFLDRKNESTSDRITMLEHDLDSIESDIYRLANSVENLSQKLRTMTVSAWTLTASIVTALIVALIGKLN